MAPHLTPSEQDAILRARAEKKSTKEIFDSVAQRRQRHDIEMVSITVVRRYLKGKTHKRGVPEVRGRPRTYSRKNVLTMNATRRAYIKKNKGAKQVNWEQIMATSRVPQADPTTAARAFAREGVVVKLRRSREKPQRTTDQEKEREVLCGTMRRWPLKRCTDDLHLISDNKRFDTPTSADAREHLSKQKVVAQLRTRSEGLETHFTKPSAKRHRKNTGGFVNVCAGISNCRVVLWEYEWPGRSRDVQRPDHEDSEEEAWHQAFVSHRRGQRPHRLQELKGNGGEA